MGRTEDDTSGEFAELLGALARTPEVAPFVGTARYRVLSCLGEGGFGIVYEVDDDALGVRVALKALKSTATGYAANIDRFKREFRAVAELVHPNLVGLHELSTAGRRWFFTMDLVRGSHFLEYVRGEAGRADERRLRSAMHQLVAGVDALHRAGFVHRDLKPSNVLIEPDGRLVILDFGLVGGAVGDDPDLAPAGGTPRYMAPEQQAGERVTGAADWYSIGVMLHDALTATSPSAEACEPAAALDDAPADLAQLCSALLRREPHARPDARSIERMLGGAGCVALEGAAARVPGGVFVGRARELAALAAAQAAVDSGAATVVRIHGQPGVGKSALLAQFLDGLRDCGSALVLPGRCHERESVPFKTFDGVVDALVRHLSDRPPEAVRRLLPREIHLAAQLFPAFEAVAALRDAGSRDLPRAVSPETRLQAFTAINELVARLAEQQTVVIAIDDLQWGDIDSARLLWHLVTAPARPAILLIVSYRTDEVGRSPALDETLRTLEVAGHRGVEIALDPLPAVDAEALAATLLGESGAASPTAIAVAKHGEGHPLFMAELARALGAKVDQAAPPPTLLDMLWQRVGLLSADARAVLETVAVAGRPLAGPLCYDAAGLGPDGIGALRALRAEQLVRIGYGGEIDVFHDRVRDAILARTDADAQRSRHLALARRLEQEPEPDLEALARHFDSASEWARAAGYAVRAADAAMHALAFDRAAGLYQLAIDRGDNGAAAAGLYVKLGEALINAGSNATAGHAFLAAAARIDSPDAVVLRARAGEHMCTAGDFEAGLEALEQAVAAVGEAIPPSPRSSREAALHLEAMRAANFRMSAVEPRTIPVDCLRKLDVLCHASKALAYGGPARAAAMMLRFARLSLEAGEPRRAALGLSCAVMGLYQFQRERPGLIDDILDRADAMADRIDDPQVRAFALRMRAESHYFFSEVRRAHELFDAAMELISEQCLGMAVDFRFCRLSSARTSMMLGALDRARAVADALLLDAIERQDPVMEKGVRVEVLAPLCLAADDPVQADAHLRRSDLEDRCAIIAFRAEAVASHAMYVGRPRDAVDAWRSRWQTLDREGILAMPVCRVMAARSLGVALLASAAAGDAGGVEQVHALTAIIRDGEFPSAAAARATLQGYLALRSGDRPAAGGLLADAAERYQSGGFVLEAAACRYRQGELLGGDAGAAAVAAANELLRDHGVVAPERWVGMQLPPLS